MLSDELKKLKEEKGLTAHQIAEQSGVPESTVIRIINGSTPDPSFSAATAMIKALGGSADTIVGIEPKLLSYRDLLIQQCQDDIAHERRQFKRVLIFICAVIAFLLVFVAVDVILPGVGWIRY